MIDFVELEVRNTPGSILLQNTIFDFHFSVSEKTGLIANKHTAVFKGLRLTIYDSGRVIIKGSIHKFRNEGYHNADEYTYRDLLDFIAWIRQLGINPKDCIIHQIEFGINICPEFNINWILTGLMFHKGKVFDRQSNGHFMQLAHQRYIIKVYDKRHLSNHLRSGGKDILRFEVKIKKMAHIEKFNICYLSDLLDFKWTGLIRELLVSIWNEILFFDLSIKNQSEADINKWSNPRYWQSLKKGPRSRELKKYREVVSKDSINIQKRVSDQINQSWKRYQLTV